MRKLPKRIMRQVVAAMRHADISPELIYAYQKTGFLLDEGGYKNLTPEDKAEYDDAIDEFFAKMTRS